MNREQFLKIKNFGPEEIERTGAKIGSVQLDLMRKLDKFRDILGCPIHIVKNGLTTGEHQSEEHGLGMAADVMAVDYREIGDVVKAALTAGFDAIGVYHNSLTYSYHLGIRGQFAFWGATKEHNGSWAYKSLFADPR